MVASPFLLSHPNLAVRTRYLGELAQGGHRRSRTALSSEPLSWLLKRSGCLRKPCASLLKKRNSQRNAAGITVLAFEGVSIDLFLGSKAQYNND
jgi:hypothetical protein